ncbi:MAG: HPP family protein [Armatimonadota bacterium]
MIRVADLMNRHPAVVRSDATLLDAVRLIAASRCSDVMVLDSGGRWEGVLSEGDVLRRMLPSFDTIRDPAADGSEILEENAEQLGDLPVHCFMIRGAITIGPDESLLRAAAIMASMNIRRLPVVAEGRLVGTLGREDLCIGLLVAGEAAS